MKRTIKKALSLFLAVVLIFSISAVSFAAEESRVIKAYNSLSKEDFHAEKYESMINRVFFLDGKNSFPDNVTYIEEYDLSAAGDGSVIGRLTLEIGGHDLYIAADGGVIANSDSSYLFANTGVREIIGFDNFDTSDVKNMRAMFLGSELESFDFSNIDTSGVIDMSLMFKDSERLKKIYGTADTLKVSDMTYMFNDCISLEEFVASISFESIGYYGIEYMFKDCYSLTTVDFSNCSYTGKLRSVNAFQNCKALEEVNFSNWNFSSVKDFSAAFTGCSSLKTLYLYDVTDIGAKCSSSNPNNGVTGLTVYTNNSQFMSSNFWTYFSKMDDVYVVYEGVESDNLVKINFGKTADSEYYTVNGKNMYAGSSWEYPVGTSVKVRLKGANVSAYNVNGIRVTPDVNGDITIYLDSSIEGDENSYVIAEGEDVINIAPQTLHTDEPFPESSVARVLLMIKNFFIDMFNFFNETFNNAFQGIKWPDIFK